MLRATPPNYIFTTLAGAAGQSGTADGPGVTARFAEPWGVAVDRTGNIYVADAANHTIRRIAADGYVTTIAGSAGQPGSVDGVGAAATFRFPSGVAVDEAGNVYVADRGNSTIRKISPAGEVSTLAGTPVSSGGGSADGTGPAAGFQSPYGVAVDTDGTIYVADTSNSTIRKITPSGDVTTFAGAALQAGRADGVGAAARFSNPHSLTIDGQHNVYVDDSDNSIVRKITPDGTVTTVPRLGYTGGLAFDGEGALCVANPDMSLVFKLADGGIAPMGGAMGEIGSADGPRNVSRFHGPGALAFDEAGAVYVTDRKDCTIRKGVPVKVAWSPPPAMLAGTVLSDVQLNATANVEGTFVYNPPSGTQIDQSWSVLAVTFTPTGGDSTTAFYEVVGITVTDPAAIITWAQPAPIDYGTSLTDAQLNAKVREPGSLEYSPGFGAVLPEGSHVLRVTFRPSDPAKASISAEVTLVVNPVAMLPLRIESQPVMQEVVPGGMATFTFLAYATPMPTFAWYESDDGFTWTTVANDQHHSGATTVTLMVTGATPDMNGRRYRCLATPAVGTGTWSDSALLEVAPSIAYTGGYFGTFAHGGTWALYVGAPSRFIAYLPSRGTVIAQKLEIDADGTFNVVCPELSAGASTGAAGRTLTLSGAITAPSQGVRPVAAELVEIGETLTGGFPRSGALTYLSGEFYTASALGTESGNLYLVVGYSGDMQAVVVTHSVVDGARGVLDASGSATLTTDTGGRLALTVDPNARSVSATLTPAAHAQAAMALGTTPRVSADVPGSIRFAGFAQSVAATSHFADIATRALCGSGNAVTIGGFVISGQGSKRVLVRAVGPTLASQGIPAADLLVDPAIEVHDASHGNVVIATNDNWGDEADAAEITSTSARIGAAALVGTDTTSSAKLLTLPAGVYTFIVNGKGAGPGVVLVEVYDADVGTPGARLVNIATRAYAATGNSVAIGGFVVTGNSPKHLLIRGVGPTLATQGLGATEVLQDPVIEVHDARQANAVIATNDNWTDNSNADEIVATAARVGATPLAGTDTTSSALLLTLPPGVYSFVASGRNGNSGVVLVEVYDAD